MAIALWDFLSLPTSTPKKTSPKFPDPEMNKNHVQKSDKMKKELYINYTTNEIPLQNLWRKVHLSHLILFLLLLESSLLL